VSDHVTIGDYSLEISGDEVLVRDENGAIVETVELDDIEGQLMLPDGQKIDLASVFAESGTDTFQTAAGPANDNNSVAPSDPAPFRAFVNTDDAGHRPGSAGTLDGTSLVFDVLDSEVQPQADPNTQSARGSFEWSRHDPSGLDQNGVNSPSGGSNYDQNQSEDDGEDERNDDFDPPSNNDQQPPAHEDAPNLPTDEQQQPQDGQQDGEPVTTPPIDEQQPPEDNGQSEDPVTPPSDEQQQPENPEQDPSPETPPSDDPQASEEALNAAPTDIDLDGTAVVENSAGAIIGALTIVDADAGDAHTLALSDDRFEVVGGQLKLKNGIWLNFESEPSVSVVVTATDSAGNQLSETFTLSVSDVNEAQTDLSLDGNQVAENAPGAIVGTLTVVDPDAADHQSFAVSDSRFEVVNEQLKLKDGVSLDYEAEQSVNVTVTATDNGGHSVQKTFTIGVADVYEAPATSNNTDPGQQIWTSQLGKGPTTLGSGDDDLYIDSSSFKSVDMGDGYDTVHVAATGLDFGHSQAAKLSDVEKIDSTGYGVNHVSLSINDVISMTDSDLHLTIVGDVGDVVSLTASSNNHWTVVDSNAQFTTYAYSDPSHQAIVEISNQLTAQVS